MLGNLKAQPADKILALMAKYKEDPRDQKIDLGVGVYKNAEGVTPVMRAVKEAERRLVEEQTSKSYVALAGDPAFADAMINLVLGDAVARDKIAAIATPGGTGAVRQAFELVKMANPTARVFVSNPTWPNHVSILNYVGIETATYRYFDTETRAVDFDGMLADLAQANAGDLVLLHGCCHNPTGANLNLTQWQAVVDLINEKGLIAMIDIAYQGFGDGLDEDAAGLRHMAARVPEMLIAASCSKNFALYRDRTGCAMVISADEKAKVAAEANLKTLMRITISMPPDHGAAIVRTILSDDKLRGVWEEELTGMRTRMLSLRQSLAEAMRARTNSDRFDFIAHHRGMFSLMGATPEQVAKLRDEHAIYAIGDSRINIAGLKEDRIDEIAGAFASVGI